MGFRNRSKGGIMARMPYIAYLAENEMEKELIEEVGDVHIAKGFIEAAREIREKRDEPAYKNLNKIHQKAVKIGEKEANS